MTEIKPGMILMGDWKTYLTPEEYEARQVALMGQYMNEAVAFLDEHPEATASVFTVVSLRGWYDVRVSRRPPRTEPAEPIGPTVTSVD